MAFNLFFYISFMLVCVLLAKHIYIYKLIEVENTKNVPWIILCIIYLFFIGLRDHVGVDWINYYYTYMSFVKGKGIPEQMDLGYYWLNDVVSFFDLGYAIIVLFLTYFLLYSMYKALDFFKFLYPYYFFFFFCIFFLESMNIMRQSLAFFASFAGFTCYFQKKIRTSLFFIALAWLFHQSSIIVLFFIPFIFFNPFKNKYLNIVLILIPFFYGLFFYGLLRDYILNDFIGLGGTRFEGGLTEYGMGVFEEQGRGATYMNEPSRYLYLAIDILFILLYSKVSEKFKEYKFDFFFCLFMIGEILQPIFIYQTLFERINLYFYLYKILITSFYCYALLNIELGRSHFIYKTFGYFIIFAYFAIFVSRITKAMPYNHLLF